MADSAFSVTSALAHGAGGGLPERLVQAGLLDEASLAEAIRGAKEARQNLVTYLVGRNIVDSRELATTAATLFGLPVMDLDSLVVDLDVVRLVPEKVLAKNRTLPLARRGRRLFVAISDPTNLHGLDEIRFSTAMQVEPIVVEDDKLQRALSRVLEQVDTSMRSLGEGDLDLEKLDTTGGDEIDAEAAPRDDVEDAPIVRFVNKVMLDAIRRGASDIHFEPYEKIYRVRLRIDGVLKEDRKSTRLNSSH